MSSMVSCDFCSGQDVKWRYRSEDFMIEVHLTVAGRTVIIPWGSMGDWAACEICSTMIEGEEWDALAQRGVDTNPLTQYLRESEIPELVEATKKMHTEFRNKRVGGRSKVW